MSEEQNEERKSAEESDNKSVKRGKFPFDLILVTLGIYGIFMAVACSSEFRLYNHSIAITIYTLVFLAWLIILNLFPNVSENVPPYEPIIGYVVLGIIVMIAVPQIPGSHKRPGAWENRCKGTLRALASSQIAFKDSDGNGEYGTWKEMTQAEFIGKGYNRSNIIDNYSIYVFDISRRSELPTETDSYTPSFTIVAIPRSQRNKLRTFAIGEDSTPRVWVGNSDLFDKNKTHLLSIEYWEPLR